MKVNCNNKEVEVAPETTVSQLVASLNYRRASVWINGEQLLAAEFDRRIIRQNDKIKILRIVAGG